ncbi:MAG: PilZ domain-containing protein [Pseudomonadota bacterium]
MTTDRKAIVSLTITDRGALQAAFMSFVEGGGVFVPTTQQYNLGDSVFLLFGLMDDTERWPVPAEVCWITSAGGNSVPGVGLKFVGEKASNVRRAIEDHLGGLINSDRVTNTM